MKWIYIICAALLFLGIADLPIGYYTFLRIIVTLGAGIIVLKELEYGINLWVIIFGIIAIIFNPIIPVYLHDKSIWMPIDIITGLCFIIKGITNKKGIS